MERAIVIGNSGAGKSTFARALRDITGLPLHYLDRLWHRPDKTTATREEFDLRLGELLAGERRLSRDIRLRVMGGEKVGIAGPNGAGKTTLLRLAAWTICPLPMYMATWLMVPLLLA